MNCVGFKQLVCWVQLRLVLPNVVVRGRTACDTCVSGRQDGVWYLCEWEVGRTACRTCVSGRQDGVWYLCEW